METLRLGDWAQVSGQLEGQSLRWRAWQRRTEVTSCIRVTSATLFSSPDLISSSEGVWGLSVRKTLGAKPLEWDHLHPRHHTQ